MLDGLSEWADAIADHLLANGVIVPLLKVGDRIYRIDTALDMVMDCTVARIAIYEEGRVYCDDSYNIFTDWETGTRVFLTKEEAEQALKESERNEAESRDCKR